jgi:hypothetical protein
LQQTLKDLYRAYQNGFDKKKPINACLSSRKSLKADPPFAIHSALKSGTATGFICQKLARLVFL